MHRKKRVFAPKLGCLETTNECDGSPLIKSTVKAIKPIMYDVTKDTRTMEVHFLCCIPLYLCRKKNPLGIKKLKTIIDGKSSTNAISGLMSSTPKSTVVPINEETEHLVLNFFQSEGYAKDDAFEMKSKYSKWFGIIDGCQFNHALRELAKESPDKWLGFQWKVNVVKAGMSMTDYRQLARNENELKKDNYVLTTTIYDLLRGLRTEHDILYQSAMKLSRTGSRGAKVTHKEVAQQYDGCDHSSNTYVKQAVTVATRLSIRTIEAIGEVCEQDCVDVILKDSTNENMKTAADVYSQKDSRLFKSFVCFGSLRGAKAFMSAVADNLEDAQVNTIYRIKHWCELHNYKPVQSNTITEQFSVSVLAIKEERKFLNLLGTEKWPDHMETIKENTLRTTLSDSELNSNSGNDSDILPSIWRCFKRLHPARARSIEHELLNKIQSPNTENPSASETPTKTTTSSTSVEEVEKKKEEELKRKRDEEMKYWERMRSVADDHLKESHIQSYQLSADEFSKQIWSSSSSKVDLVISSIPRDAPTDQIKYLPSFCKQVLKSGSYVFFLVTESQYALLKEEFKAKDFKVMDDSYKIVYDTTTIKKRQNEDFPQRNSDIGIMAKTKGRHPENFHPTFSNKADEDLATVAVRYASVLNVKSCQNKLRKPNAIASVSNSEKSVDLFTYFISMLTPPSGNVLDPLAGAMTASIASLQTGRSCISIEEDSDCFKLALGRARIFATPHATLEHLDKYVEVIDVDAIADDDSTDEPSPPLKKSRIAILDEKRKENVNMSAYNQENSNRTKENTIQPSISNAGGKHIRQSQYEKDGIDALIMISEQK